MSPGEPPIRVLVADDDAGFRASYGRILAAVDGFEPVGEAADGERAVELAERLHPDVALLDVQMPRCTGLEAMARIDLARTACLLLTTFDLDEYVAPALAGGASGYLLKSASPEEVLAAIRAAHRGAAALAPEITRRLLDQYAPRATRPSGALAGVRLSPRELEVIRLVARGLSNAEIAEALTVTPETVRTYLKRVAARTGIGDRTRLALAARDAGLLPEG